MSGDDDPMSRRKKNKSPKTTPSVTIELEEDAEEVFLEHIEKHFSPMKTVEEQKPRAKSRGRSELASFSIDLHGDTLSVACDRLRGYIADKIASHGHFKLRVITGKGRHSGEGGGILSESVHDFVKKQFWDNIVSIESSPHETKVGGLPVRGHFDVEIKG